MIRHCGAWLLLLTATAVSAAPLQVVPSRIDLRPEAPRTRITVTNPGETEFRGAIGLAPWVPADLHESVKTVLDKQRRAEEVLIVTPSEVRLAPGQSMTVTVALRGLKLDRPAFYQLHIGDAPLPDLRIVCATFQADPDLQFFSTVHDGRTVVGFFNRGAATARLSGYRWSGAAPATLATEVLPGQKFFRYLDPSGAAPLSLEVEGKGWISENVGKNASLKPVPAPQEALRVEPEPIAPAENDVDARGVSAEPAVSTTAETSAPIAGETEVVQTAPAEVGGAMPSPPAPVQYVLPDSVLQHNQGAAMAPAPAPAPWRVTTASFPTAAQAQVEIAALKQMGFDALMTPTQVRGATWYRVQVPYASKADASAGVKALRQQGRKDAWLARN